MHVHWFIPLKSVQLGLTTREHRSRSIWLGIQIASTQYIIGLDLHVCIVISRRCICRKSCIHVYQPVKAIILDVNTSLLFLRSPCMPTQLILSYFHGFVILIKFYRFLTLFNAIPTNVSFWYDHTYVLRVMQCDFYRVLMRDITCAYVHFHTNCCCQIPQHTRSYLHSVDNFVRIQIDLDFGNSH